MDHILKKDNYLATTKLNLVQSVNLRDAYSYRNTNSHLFNMAMTLFDIKY